MKQFGKDILYCSLGGPILWDGHMVSVHNNDISHVRQTAQEIPRVHVSGKPPVKGVGSVDAAHKKSSTVFVFYQDWYALGIVMACGVLLHQPARSCTWNTPPEIVQSVPPPVSGACLTTLRAGKESLIEPGTFCQLNSLLPSAARVTPPSLGAG